jgi:hypothetical protein
VQTACRVATTHSYMLGVGQIEWIDDRTCNVVFRNRHLAREALLDLSFPCTKHQLALTRKRIAISGSVLNSLIRQGIINHVSSLVSGSEVCFTNDEINLLSWRIVKQRFADLLKPGTTSVPTVCSGQSGESGLAIRASTVLDAKPSIHLRKESEWRRNKRLQENYPYLQATEKKKGSADIFFSAGIKR